MSHYGQTKQPQNRNMRKMRRLNRKIDKQQRENAIRIQSQNKLFRGIEIKETDEDDIPAVAGLAAYNIATGSSPLANMLLFSLTMVASVSGDQICENRNTTQVKMRH